MRDATIKGQIAAFERSVSKETWEAEQGAAQLPDADESRSV